MATQVYKGKTIVVDIFHSPTKHGYFLTVYTGEGRPPGQSLAGLSQLFTLASSGETWPTEDEAIRAAFAKAKARIDEYVS